MLFDRKSSQIIVLLVITRIFKKRLIVYTIPKKADLLQPTKRQSKWLFERSGSDLGPHVGLIYTSISSELEQLNGEKGKRCFCSEKVYGVYFEVTLCTYGSCKWRRKENTTGKFSRYQSKRIINQGLLYLVSLFRWVQGLSESLEGDKIPGREKNENIFTKSSRQFSKGSCNRNG